MESPSVAARSRFTAHRACFAVGIGAVALAVAGWSSAVAPAADLTPETTLAARPAATLAPPVADLDPLGVGRLAAYTAAAVQPRVTARSPFAFATTAATIEPPGAQRRVAPQAPARAVAPVADDPAPSLAGVASQDSDGAISRTAVFMTPDGAVEFAVKGQSIGGGRFRVSDITADGAVVVNLRTGASARLVLQ